MKYGPSLRDQLHQRLGQDVGDLDSNVKTITTPSLKIINNTVVFGNSVYQIRNICTVQLIDLTKTYAINQNAPGWYWLLFLLGIILLFFYGLGILILIFVAWLFWQHSKLDKIRRDAKYGLKISMSSGQSVIVTSRKKDFVLKIILTLYDIINDKKPKAIEFHFETFEDKSIKIEQAYGSSVVSGQVGGDVVNNMYETQFLH